MDLCDRFCFFARVYVGVWGNCFFFGGFHIGGGAGAGVGG